MATLVWPSTPVVKCSVALAGMVELRWIGDYAAEGFDAEGERGDVEEEEVVGGGVVLAGEDLGLDGGAKGDDLVGVELGVELLVAGGEIEEFGDERAHCGDAGRAADHDDFVDVGGREAGVLQGLLYRDSGAGDHRRDELLELRAGDLAQVFVWFVIPGGDLRFARTGGNLQLNPRTLVGTQRDLGFDHSFAQLLNDLGVLCDVETEIALDVIQRDGGEQVVDVVSAQMRIAARTDDLEDALVQLEDGDVEGATAEVVYGDDAVLVLIEAVSERSGGGLVDEAEDVEAGDAARIFGRLSLRIVEVGGHGDDGLGDFGAEEALGVALELEQDVGGDFGRREGEAADVELEHFAGLQAVGEVKGEECEFGGDVGEVAAHEALDGVDGVGRVGEQDVAGGVADGEALRRVLVEGDDGGNDGRAVFAGDDGGGRALHERDEGVGGAQVDADDAICFCHRCLFQAR
jgi:hypothetical protein